MNRIRLIDEVTSAVADVVGADRTAVRVSPNGERQGVNGSHPEALFVAVAELLSRIGIAFLEVREPGFEGTFGKAERAHRAIDPRCFPRTAHSQLRLPGRHRAGGARPR